MMNSSTLVQLLSWVLVGLPSNSKGVPVPSFTNIHSLNDLSYNIQCTKPMVILVWVLSSPETFFLVPIATLVVVPDSHLLGIGFLSGSKVIPPWLQSSLIVPRHLLTWLSVVVLEESELEAKTPECTTLFDVLRVLDVPTSLLFQSLCFKAIKHTV
jgi:hypothetical protein